MVSLQLLQLKISFHFKPNNLSITIHSFSSYTKVYCYFFFNLLDMLQVLNLCRNLKNQSLLPLNTKTPKQRPKKSQKMTKSRDIFIQGLVTIHLSILFIGWHGNTSFWYTRCKENGRREMNHPRQLPELNYIYCI